MEVRLLFELLAYTLVLVESSLCPEEDGLTDISVCSTKTVTSNDFALSTEGIQDVSTGSCSCTVTVYTVGNVQAPTLYYTGPGYPNCGVEFDVNGSIFTCDDGYVTLLDDVYEITYRRTVLNSDPEACLLFLSGGLNIEFKVACQQPSTNATRLPVNTKTSTVGVLSSHKTTSTIITASETALAITTQVDTETTSVTRSASILSSSSLTNLSTTSDSQNFINSSDGTTTTPNEDITTPWQNISSTNYLKDSPTVSTSKTSNLPSNISISTSTLPEHLTTSRSRTDGQTAETTTFPVVSSGNTVTTNTDFVESSGSSISNHSSVRTTDIFLSTGREVYPSTEFSAEKNEDQFPYILVVSICSGFLAVSIFVILFLVLRRRSRSKRTSIPRTIYDQPPYIDAYINDEHVTIDDSVYFTGIPVILDGLDHPGQAQIDHDGLDHPDQAQIDQTLITPRETDVYYVVMKQPQSFVSLPTPRLESFQGTVDPLEESDIDDEIIDLIEQNEDNPSDLIQNKKSSVSFSYLDEPTDNRTDHDIKTRNKHQRFVSFRNTIQYNDEDDTVNENIGKFTDKRTQDVRNKQPRSASFCETKRNPIGGNVHNELNNFKIYSEIRKSVSFRDHADSPSTIMDTPTESSETKGSTRRISSKDRVRDMFLKDLRKALQKRDIERHAF